MTDVARPWFFRLIEKKFAELTDGDSFSEWMEKTSRMDYDEPPMDAPNNLSEDEQAEWIAEEAVIHWMIGEHECFFEEQALKQEADAEDMYWENRISQAMEEGI